MSAVAKADLAMPDAECTLLGSFLMAPKALQVYAGEIKPDWFTEAPCAALWERMKRETDAGRTISFMSLVNALPSDLGGVDRNKFMAAIAASAMPANSIAGIVQALKETWARRKLQEDAAMIATNAIEVGTDPFELVRYAISSLDEVNAAQVHRNAGMFDDGARDLDADLTDKEALRGATTGLHVLDERLNGYKRGCLYVLAGRPGMGKSAVALSSLRRTAQAGHGVAFFSLEMSQQEVAARIVSDVLYGDRRTPIAPPYGRIVSGKITDNQHNDVRQGLASLKGLPFYWDSSPRLNMSQIASEARRQKAIFEAKGQSLDVLCIDHMGLVEPSNRYRGNKVAEAGEVSGTARALAKELDCCVLLLSQLSRNVESREDKRPTMSDLRWAGEIEQDAHVVGLLFREHYYLEKDHEADPADLMATRNKLEFIIGKNRNGEGGTAELFCSIQHNAVRDAS